MEINKIEDLIEGEIYYSKYPTNYEYIFKAGKINTNNSTCIEVNKKELHVNNSSFMQKTTFAQLFDLRVANTEEKAHLNACIKANKFIPLSEVVNQEPYFCIY